MDGHLGYEKSERSDNDDYRNGYKWEYAEEARVYGFTRNTRTADFRFHRCGKGNYGTKHAFR